MLIAAPLSNLLRLKLPDQIVLGRYLGGLISLLCCIAAVIDSSP